ncbi:hypothetical protein SporoP8_01215 [Sporosarcina ureae]|uniref:hypothetical protein n=1 Tax=Sporosarcina ureae TaxID=1571 RepID=UPI000A153AB6|nr:hypothetical protein [Sporosarcina ureae]ARJ37621.1 hypothetical protein SporoP8_01215 [Sporosarcina ureae]
MEYWDITENPSEEIYRKLINTLCDHSDTFYFITRKELTYNQDILEQFKPYTLETYKTKEWANTITKGPAATVFVVESNDKTCKLLKYHAHTLYDWVAPDLPEDLTFMKNNFAWFSCTTHEEFSSFSIRSDHYKEIIHSIEGLKIQKSE